MTRIDPIIAVADVDTSAAWYTSVFECSRKHGENDFAVLVTAEDAILICLHKWGAHEHPTMKDPTLTPGNGLILYFRIQDMDKIRHNVEQLEYPVEEEVHFNPNSMKKEFSLRDPDGYYLTITEFHTYDG